jgi:hypothetical protein
MLKSAYCYASLELRSQVDQRVSIREVIADLRSDQISNLRSRSKPSATFPSPVDYSSTRLLLQSPPGDISHRKS